MRKYYVFTLVDLLVEITENEMKILLMQLDKYYPDYLYEEEEAEGELIGKYKIYIDNGYHMIAYWKEGGNQNEK